MRDWILFALGGAVVTALLYWGAQNIVPLALFLNLFTPMPAAYTHMRYGTLPGGLAVFGACVILAVIFPATMAGGYLLQFGILSFVIPLLLDRELALVIEFQRLRNGQIGLLANHLGGRHLLDDRKSHQQYTRN